MVLLFVVPKDDPRRGDRKVPPVQGLESGAPGGRGTSGRPGTANAAARIGPGSGPGGGVPMRSGVAIAVVPVPAGTGSRMVSGGPPVGDGDRGSGRTVEGTAGRAITIHKLRHLLTMTLPLALRFP